MPSKKTSKTILLNSLSAFTGREEKLRNITRYSLYEVMFYRTNLWNHSRRVAILVEEITPFATQVFGSTYDPQKASALALVHDDAEMLTGDVQAGNKSKMSAEELAAVDQHEQNAITQLAASSPKTVGPYSYEELLQEALDKNSLEAQVVMLADKLDAFGEALHEVYAGNKLFVTNVVNEYGTIPTPYDYYIGYLSSFTTRYPLMQPLFTHATWLFKIPQTIDFKIICNTATPHTLESIAISTGYPHYDEWKKTLLRYSTLDELAELYTQTEQL